MSHKCRRPEKYIATAEILEADEAIDEGKVLAEAFTTILGVKDELRIETDSEDLFYLLSIQMNSYYRVLELMVAIYDFETKRVNKIYWIAGKDNLSDPVTKANSPLDPALQLLHHIGIIPIEFPNAKSRSSNKFFGQFLKHG